MIKILFLLSIFLWRPARAEEVRCNELLDNFCRDFWAPGREGNFKTIESEFAAGRSAKSELSQVDKLNLMALINNAKKFPKELSKNKEYMGVIGKLKNHLARENPSKVWRKELDLIYAQLDVRIELILHETMIKKFPAMKNKPERLYTPDDWYNYLRLRNEYYNAILDAKIKDSPQWKRVVETFLEVRQKILVVIDQTKLPLELKDKLKSQLMNVELSLPYADPELLGASPDCGRTMPQAFYDYTRRKITVCAGYFYGYQSKAFLTRVMSHELAHSIDLTQFSFDAFRATPTGEALSKVVHTEGPIQSCKMWNELVEKGNWDTPKEAKISPHGAFEKFKGCLRNKTDLKPLTFENLQNASEFLNDKIISAYATNFTYSFMSSDKIWKDNKLIDNPYFLRADLKSWGDAGFSNSYQLREGTSPIHFFVYNLVCEKGKDEPRDILKLSEDDRQKAFAEALKNSRTMSINHTLKLFETCGDECSSLVSFNLAMPTGENFADWIANRVITLILKEKPVERKRDFINEATASFCEKPEFKFDPALKVTEKHFSREVHSDSSQRRASMLTPDVAQELQCKITPSKTTNFSECEL